MTVAKDNLENKTKAKKAIEIENLVEEEKITK